MTSECFDWQGEAKSKIVLRKLENDGAIQHLQWLAALQYPESEQQCLKHEMALWRSGSFWASLLMQMLAAGFGSEVDLSESCGGYVGAYILQYIHYMNLTRSLQETE